MSPKVCLKILIVVLSILISTELEIKRTNWIQELDVTLKREFNSYHTVIMIDQKTNDKILDELLKKFFSNVPSRLINILQTNPLNSNSISSRSIQSTTRFLTILSGKTDPKIPLEYLLQISGGATHPHCLMILLQGNNYKKLLRFAWSKRILDLTILEVVLTPNSTDNGNIPHSTMEQNVNYLMTTSLVMHYFNPYNKSYTHRKFSARELIFPNKLDDLKGYEMKVVSVESSVFVNVKRNSSGHAIKTWGLQINLHQTLAELQNFRFSEISYPGTQVGRASCQRNNSTGTLKKLYHNEFHFITSSLIIPSGCKHYVNTFAFENENFRHVIIVPITRTSRTFFSITTTSLGIVLLTLCIIIFIHLTVRILRLNYQFWRIGTIFQMLLGISVPEDLGSSLNRIVLPFILFGFMLMSSVLHSLLTDVVIMVQTESVMSTLNDVNQSKLVLMMSVNNREAASALDNVDIVKDLLKKSRSFPNADYCTKMVLDYQNVTCLVGDITARRITTKYVTKEGNNVAKILPEVFIETPKAIMMEPNFPSAFRFEKNMNRITQYGLKIKWIRDIFPSGTTSKASGISLVKNQSTLLVILYWILFIGYGISLVAFLGELLRESWRKRFRAKDQFVLSDLNPEQRKKDNE